MKISKWLSILLTCWLCLMASPGGQASSVKEITSVIDPGIQILSGVIKNGDTVSSILETYLPLKDIYEIDKKSRDVFSLNQIRKGQPYRIVLFQHHLIGFQYEINNKDCLIIKKEDFGFSIDRQAIQYNTRLEVVSGIIENSLEETIKKIGERCELACLLADIFAWDIDFLRDVKSGDNFTVLVNKKYKNDQLCGYGDIQAAFFSNDGIQYKAFLYKDGKGICGYYDENGKSLRKAFLKAPLTFTRISSKFTNSRLHPIFKDYRPHQGVDYAAPAGTPIKSVGDGVITRIGYNKGMGNFITIWHRNGYTTSYNHMSKFAKGMKNQVKVLQGQVIGYVGMSGYATGPHLDFRMTKNGRPLDPLKYQAVPASPIQPEEMKTFHARSESLAKKIQESI